MLEVFPFQPYELQDGFALHPTDSLRAQLEPVAPGEQALRTCNEKFDYLAQQGVYKKPAAEGFYLYRQHLGDRCLLGLWCQVSAKGTLGGHILGHEAVLEDKFAAQQAYRKKVGLEGSPVLLAYREDPVLDRLMMGWSLGVPDFSYQWDSQVHEFWRIEKPTEVGLIIGLVARLEQVYIADGHHRMAVAASYDPMRTVSALLVGVSQLQIGSYHRLVELPADYRRDKLLWTIEKHWYHSAIPDNRPYVPDRKGRIGMCLEGRWYQLDLKPESGVHPLLADAQLLQETILYPGIGLREPSTAKGLHYFVEGELAQHTGTGKVAFTLFPMTGEELLRQAETGCNLPPKSTRISPRIPYGLLLNDLHTHKAVAG